MALLPLEEREKAEVIINPAKGFDVGEGSGKEVVKIIEGGVVGLVIDARGRRPFILPEDDKLRIDKLIEWNTELSVYPKV